MHSEAHFNWLKSAGLYNLAQSTKYFFRRVLLDCLNAKPGEEILIIGDRGNFGQHIAGVMSGAYYFAAKDLKLKPTLITQKIKTPGDPASDLVVKALSELKQGNLIVLNLSNKLGSIKEICKSYRTFARENKHRFLSSPSLGMLDTHYYQFLIEAINVDYVAMQEKARKIKKILDKAEIITIKTRKGTNLVYDVEGMKAIANDGDFREPGTGGNLPVGEVYIPPRGKTNVNGTVVIDGSIRCKKCTLLIKDPVKLIVKDGDVIEIQGKKEAKLLQQSIDEAKARAKFPKNVAKLSELGIGINPRSKIVGATILDEKAHLTAHVAIGSNAWFGGANKTLIHLDQVFKDPIIIVDGKRLRV